MWVQVVHQLLKDLPFFLFEKVLEQLHFLLIQEAEDDLAEVTAEDWLRLILIKEAEEWI